jgi:hypothetical protein
VSEEIHYEMRDGWFVASIDWNGLSFSRVFLPAENEARTKRASVIALFEAFEERGITPPQWLRIPWLKARKENLILELAEICGELGVTPAEHVALDTLMDPTSTRAKP